jgi:hypothetical protein
MANAGTDMPFAYIAVSQRVSDARDHIRTCIQGAAHLVEAFITNRADSRFKISGGICLFLRVGYRPMLLTFFITYYSLV